MSAIVGADADGVHVWQINQLFVTRYDAVSSEFSGGLSRPPFVDVGDGNDAHAVTERLLASGMGP